VNNSSFLKIWIGWSRLGVRSSEIPDKRSFICKFKWCIKSFSLVNNPPVWQNEEYLEDDMEFVNKDEDYEEAFQALLSSSLDDHITRSKSQDPRSKIFNNKKFGLWDT
jgi:hypothetical protein